MEHGERIAILETKMDNIEKRQSEIMSKLDEQTKQIYKGLGALAALLVLVEIGLAIFRH